MLEWPGALPHTAGATPATTHVLASAVAAALQQQGTADVDGDTVVADMDGISLRIRTRAGTVKQLGSTSLHRVTLYCWVSGGPFGQREVLLATSGFGYSEREAIETGGQEWGQLLGPVLHAAAGTVEPSAHCEVAVLGQVGYQVVCNCQDRGISLGDAVDCWPQLFADLRQELAPSQWLSPVVIASQTLPPLPRGQMALLSIAVVDAPAARSVDVSVNGRDWPGAAPALSRIPTLVAGLRTVVLREVAVLIPQ